MGMTDNAVLGVAMGTSEAAGYVDPEGHIKPWLNELAFAPVDYSEEGEMCIRDSPGPALRQPEFR